MQAKDQNLKLPADYTWIHENKIYNIGTWLLKAPFALFADLLGYAWLHIHVENREVLDKYRHTGIFVYMNHTQEVGDPFLPHVILKRNYYAICSPSNLSIPVLGKMLPALGALPIPEGMEPMKQFRSALKQRIEEKQAIVIFPEAHVWPWYTKIRPFSDVSFQFPCDLNAPCFAVTVIYQDKNQKKQPGNPARRPSVTCHIDGPFFPDPALPRRKQRKLLHDQIEAAMKTQAGRSNYEYVRYIQKAPENSENTVPDK